MTHAIRLITELHGENSEESKRTVTRIPAALAGEGFRLEKRVAGTGPDAAFRNMRELWGSPAGAAKVDAGSRGQE